MIKKSRRNFTSPIKSKVVVEVFKELVREFLTWNKYYPKTFHSMEMGSVPSLKPLVLAAAIVIGEKHII